MKILFFVVTFTSLLFAEMGIAYKNVNIREDASINSLKVGLLIKNDVANISNVLPNKHNPEWYKIDRGYVSAKAFTFLQSESLTATAKSLKEMNIRQRPSVRSLKIGTLKKNEIVEVLTAIPNKENPEWYETDRGYIYAKFLLIEESSESIEENRYKNIKVKFLTTQELKELLINRPRVGKTRNFKNGEYFKSKFNIDGTFNSTIYNKNGEKIKESIQGKWIISNNAFCVVTNNEVLDSSCRKVFKNSNGVYVSVLMSDRNIWAKFLIQ